ncbi:hypothetical protein FH972_001834 [Carpinus fangiana]|uniref:Uncharacterized protein n=1 Tax=Carpinus fangiana TaxID=176857 RepID=A0A5N6QEU4_9ROSI|nr:hypothetical protein FH972_001834 [Carpinus fangiana]
MAEDAIPFWQCHAFKRHGYKISDIALKLSAGFYGSDHCPVTFELSQACPNVKHGEVFV